MSAVSAVAAQTRRMLWRDGRLPVALALVTLLGLLSILVGGQRAAESERDRVAADATERATFAGQGVRNPHSVAHFSRFAFLPIRATSTLDPGIGAYAGSAVWMEAHSQDPPNLRTAEDRVELGRFSELSLAWLAQLLLPLLVIVLGFDALAGERERGTLAMTLGAGVTLKALVRGKALALAQVFFGLLLVLIAVQVGSALWLFDADARDLLRRALVWGVAHAAYLALWIAATLVASLRFSLARNALVALIAGWALVALIVPRLAATSADLLAPAPAPGVFAAAIRHDLQNGINGDDPADARSAAFEQRILAQYKVARVEDLPVSFAGLSLQAGEEYGNRVFDRHFGALADTYGRQIGWRRAWSVVSPLPALQHLSMAAAATDIAHHVDFVGQAERTRRTIVRLLNEDLIRHGAGKDFNYMADPALWARMPEFHYASPSFGGAIVRQLPDVLILLAWLLGIWLLLRHAVRRAERPR